MRLLRVQFTVRKVMVAVAIAGLSLGGVDAVRAHLLASKYRRKANAAARMEQRCRAIDAMDPATRAREAEVAFDNPYLDNPDWNRKMIEYFALIKLKYRRAADHPRVPIMPDPPNP